MVKERLKSPRARLFVALDLPEDVREELAAWQRRECTDPALRVAAPEALHITLCFLSWQRERDIEAIAELATGIAPRPVRLRFAREASARPPKGRARLFAVEAESPATLELQAEISDRLEAKRFYKPEKRPFWPHVTVARVRPERDPGAGGKRRRGKRYQRVAEPPGLLPKPLEQPFDAVRVCLYRSNLRPQGAEYVSLATKELPPTEAEKR